MKIFKDMGLQTSESTHTFYIGAVSVPVWENRAGYSVYPGACYIGQCPKLRFYCMHPPGAFLLKLCTRDYLHAPSLYVVMIHLKKKGAHAGCHLRKLCTRRRKCARRVQGAPLISDTVGIGIAREGAYMVTVRKVIQESAKNITFSLSFPLPIRQPKDLYTFPFVILDKGVTWGKFELGWGNIKCEKFDDV